MNDTGQQPVLLAAGGTGGHLFPAQALAHVLAARGVPVELVTDFRALRYGQDFPARKVHSVASATPAGGFGGKARAALMLAAGTGSSIRLLLATKPRVVVGFGGYPTVPPMLAAAMLRMPCVLHEQNAVMGRANRVLARRATRIATGFPLAAASPDVLAKTIVTGNPIRPAVLAAATRPRRTAYNRLKVLVTGGSQGARVFAEIVPAALALLAPDERARIDLVQQARPEDLARAQATYHQLGFAADLAPFFADLPDRIAAADLVIGRAGASTVSELAAIGRASILVPYPHALDADQAANAVELARTGAAEVVAQAQFTPEDLADRLRAALANPDELTRRANAAKSAGILDAADRLADLVLAVAGDRAS